MGAVGAEGPNRASTRHCAQLWCTPTHKTVRWDATVVATQLAAVAVENLAPGRPVPAATIDSPDTVDSHTVAQNVVPPNATPASTLDPAVRDPRRDHHPVGPKNKSHPPMTIPIATH